MPYPKLPKKCSCGAYALYRVTSHGWYCDRCGNFMPEDSEENY